MTLKMILRIKNNQKMTKIGNKLQRRGTNCLSQNYKSIELRLWSKILTTKFMNISQEIINRALKAWSKKCKQIYYNKGSHIKKQN